LCDAFPVGFLKRFVEARQLRIDEMNNSGFDGSRILIFWDDLCAQGLNGPGFLGGEEAPGARGPTAPGCARQRSGRHAAKKTSSG
jgi:hypothetical protein